MQARSHNNAVVLKAIAALLLVLPLANCKSKAPRGETTAEPLVLAGGQTATVEERVASADAPAPPTTAQPKAEDRSASERDDVGEECCCENLSAEADLPYSLQLREDCEDLPAAGCTDMAKCAGGNLGKPSPGEEVWAVYFQTDDDTRLFLEEQDLEFGENIFEGELSCDVGASETLDLAPDTIAFRAYFPSRKDARQFAGKFNAPPLLGTAKVRASCITTARTQPPSHATLYAQLVENMTEHDRRIWGTAPPDRGDTECKESSDGWRCETWVHFEGEDGETSVEYSYRVNRDGAIVPQTITTEMSE